MPIFIPDVKVTEYYIIWKFIKMSKIDIHLNLVIFCVCVPK